MKIFGFEMLEIERVLEKGFLVDEIKDELEGFWFPLLVGCSYWSCCMVLKSLAKIKKSGWLVAGGWKIRGAFPVICRMALVSR